MLRTFRDGTLTAATPIASRRPAGAIHQLEVVAADDGGGFAIWSDHAAGSGRVTIARFGTSRARRVIDARITGIELNQGVQRTALPPRSADPRAPIRYAGVNPVARRTGVVRVYAGVREGTPAVEPPQVTLRAFRGGRGIYPGVASARGMPTDRLRPGPRGTVTPADRTGTASCCGTAVGRRSSTTTCSKGRRRSTRSRSTSSRTRRSSTSARR
ncbi:MAG: hypothetical protein M0P31_15795 [Solirubrobacteraceae bacterium]|nr:hypothetical protein [Solirubrobacteraceae bacterium]